MKKSFSFFIIYISGISFLDAQPNLVPNPGFEIYSSCPSGAGEITKAIPWSSPTIATPDYFNSCNTSGVGVPLNVTGYQFAHNGNAYAGIGCYGEADPNFRDYIQVPLSDTLISNRQYLISFFVSLADFSFYSVNTLGALLTSTAISSSSSQVLPYVPQIENPVTNNLNDTSLWYLISDTITALGGEKYITIGNFQDFSTSGIDTANSSSSAMMAYYFVDDISVLDITVGIHESDPWFNFYLYPNPSGKEARLKFTPKGNDECHLVVCDLTGKQLYSQLLPANENESVINTSELQNGLYFYYILANKIIAGTGKLIIQH